MIIVTGAVTIRPADIDEAIAISLDHVHRSRREPGCVLHSVHRDVEDDNRLVFLEQWEDRATLDADFAVPASIEFVTSVAALATTPPSMDLFEVQRP